MSWSLGLEVIRNSSEISREGGIVTVIDITGSGMDMTFEEAKYWPLGKKIIKWSYDEESDSWINPEMENRHG